MADRSSGTGSKAPTVYDVAARAGVSIATVSRVFSAPDAVRAATRERVLGAVRDLGYVPSGSARGLAASRTNVVGLLFPDRDAAGESRPAPSPSTGPVPIVVDTDTSPPRSQNLYYDEVLRGAEAEAWSRGFALMIAAGRGSGVIGADRTATGLAGRVDGLAVFAGTLPDDVLLHIHRRIPVVVLAGSRGLESLDHVSANNFEGMRALVRHAVGARAPEAGTDAGARPPAAAPRSVVYVDGHRDAADALDRLAGFHSALATESFAGEVRVLPGDFSRGGGRAAADTLLAEGVDALPDLVVCANDQTALGVLDRFRALGVDVPGRVRVTGFDGIEAGRLAEPRLTTVHQPMFELGRMAVIALGERLAEPALPPRALTLPVEVLLRASCP